MQTPPQEAAATSAPTSIPSAFPGLTLAWKPPARKAETPAAQPAPRLAKLDLTLENAGRLYLVLRRKTLESTACRPASAKPRGDLTRLLEVLEAALHGLPSTAPKWTRLTLEMPPRDAAYLRAVVGNKKRDEWRRRQVRVRGVFSLDVLMDQAEAASEAGGGGPALPVPAEPDRPERALWQTEVRRALAGLPEELAGLLGPLQDAEGNVSELARRLGRPQRWTARQVERLRKHLKKMDLDPV